MGQTRRQFLARLGVTAGITAGAALALPATPEGHPAERTLAPWQGERPELDAERDTPHALWQYRPGRDGFVATLPINVVIALGGGTVGLADAMDVLDDGGWVRRPAGDVRFALNARTERYERAHATAAGTYFGGFGRHHVRAWRFGPSISIQAHEDTPATPDQGIRSFESTKYRLENAFAAAGWTVKPDGARFANAAAPDHAGLVTVIEP